MRNNQMPKAGGSAVKTALIMFTVIVIGICVLPYGVLLLVGMVPSFVAWMIDQREEKNAAMSVSIMNLCGVIPLFLALFAKGSTLTAAITLIREPVNMLTMYGAAGLGWLLIMAMPPVMGFLFNIQSAETIRKLEARKEKLIAEWGENMHEVTIEINAAEIAAQDPI
jgi:hypothetical protein